MVGKYNAETSLSVKNLKAAAFYGGKLGLHLNGTIATDGAPGTLEREEKRL